MRRVGVGVGSGLGRIASRRPGVWDPAAGSGNRRVLLVLATHMIMHDHMEAAVFKSFTFMENIGTTVALVAVVLVGIAYFVFVNAPVADVAADAVEPAAEATTGDAAAPDAAPAN